MDETSETESQGRDSKIDADGSAIPAIITDDYFEEVSAKCSEVCTNPKWIADYPPDPSVLPEPNVRYQN